MRATLALLTLAALAGCASAPPHGRGGYHRGGGEFERGGAPSQFGAAAQRIARPGADPDAVLIAGFDENFDLVISANEITDGIVREFARADANHDHVISREEFATWSRRAFGGAYPPHWLVFDSDGDGRVTAAEFAAEIHALAARHDADGDGLIDHAELVLPDVTRGETADSAASDDDRDATGGPPRPR